jgi:hypothetical protein
MRERQHRHHLQRAEKASKPMACRKVTFCRLARQVAQVTACTAGKPTLVLTGDGRYVHPGPSRLALADPGKRGIPEDTQEFAINSNMRHWDDLVKRYIDECFARQGRPARQRLQHAGLRPWWLTHRILSRGGVFLYPWDKREPEKLASCA